MQQCGADPAWISSRRATINAAEKDGIVAHIELHIEQGNVLERSDCDIGVVSGIRGSSRSWVRLTGAYDHSGATPMGPAFRRDSNLALARMIVKLDDLLDDFNQRHPELPEAVVQTFGVINSSEAQNRLFPALLGQAISRVSGYAYFSHEVRSCSPELALAYLKEAASLMRKQAEAMRVDVDIEPISSSSGIEHLDATLQQQTVASCNQQQLRFTHLPSGAWHDVAVLCHQQRSDAGSIPTGMIFIPCRNGISHSAEEYASFEQIACGASILADVLLSL